MDRNNTQIIEIMALSEDIGTINLKLKELTKELHDNFDLFGNAKEMSQRLSEKVRELTTKINTYKPTKHDVAKMATPSYVEEGMKPQRIVPGPDNYIVPEDRLDDTVVGVPASSKVNKVNTPPNKKPFKQGVRGDTKNLGRRTKKSRKKTFKDLNKNG